MNKTVTNSFCVTSTFKKSYELINSDARLSPPPSPIPTERASPPQSEKGELWRLTEDQTSF